MWYFIERSKIYENGGFLTFAANKMAVCSHFMAKSGMKEVWVRVANCWDINTLHSTEVAYVDWLDIHLVFGHKKHFSSETQLECKPTYSLVQTAAELK